MLKMNYSFFSGYFDLMVDWNLAEFTQGFIAFGIGDKNAILSQLSKGTRMILEEGIRGHMMTVDCKAKKVERSYYVWLTNDERRKLIRRLTWRY
jgi:hypothetical protein